MYTKIVAHNKKEETLKAREMKTRRCKKKEEEKEARNKTKRAEEASASGTPAEGPPQEINENAQLDQYLQNAGFSGTAVIVKNGKFF